MTLVRVVSFVTLTIFISGLAAGLSACSMIGLVPDAAQMTRIEANRLSLEEQFVLYHERYERIHELFLEAQLQVFDKSTPWISLTNGIVPSSGIYGPTSVQGSTGKNSYYIDVRSAIHPAEAQGDQEDLRAMIEFFDRNGWKNEIHNHFNHGWEARAVTDDGYHIYYTVQHNGQYNVSVLGGAYWADTKQLLREIADRLPEGWLPEERLPGEYEPFPRWHED